MKRYRKLKKRIVSGLIALLIILTPLCSPITVRADENTALESALASTVEEENKTSEDVAEDSVTSGELLSSEAGGESEETVSEEKNTSEEEFDNKDNSKVAEESVAGEETTTEENSAGQETSGKETSEEKSSEKKPFGQKEISGDEGDVLHEVMLEKTEDAELSVFSTLEESDVEINPIRVRAEEEGLEVIKGYEISGKAENTSDETDLVNKENSGDTEEPVNTENTGNGGNAKGGSNSEDSVLSDDNTENAVNHSEESTEVNEDTEEKLFVKAEVSEEADLNPRETVALYSVEDNKAKDVIIEDISLESEPCEIDEDVTGIALVKDTGYRHLNFELFPDEQDSGKKVTLDGMMPKDARGTVSEVTESENLSMDSETDETEGASADGSVEDVESETETTEADNLLGQSKVILAYDIAILDGDTKYQPGEERPVTVTIQDERILSEANLSLWHIKDDGSREEVTDFTVEDGKICFAAAGFSVYEIVDAPEEPTLTPSAAIRLEDMISTEKNEIPLIFYLDGNKYFTKTINGNNAFQYTSTLSLASTWYIEKTTEDYYLIYTYVNDSKSYVKNHSGNLVSFAEDGSLFEISEATADFGSGFYIKLKNENKWLQYSKGGNGIRFWTDKKNVPNSLIMAYYASSLEKPDDPFGFDGQGYVLMHYSNGVFGYALLPESKNTKTLKALEAKTKVNPITNNGVNLITEDTDAPVWVFHNVEENQYTISTTVGGQEKYLKASNSALTVTDNETDATQFTVTSGTGDKSGKIRLSTDTKTVHYNEGFEVATYQNNSDFWITLADKTDLLDDDFVVYSARKVSIAENAGEVNNENQVIVYTRIWDDENKKYDFYAIDHDGSLRLVFERGDNIMWSGNQVNSLLWDFTEYYYEGTDTPNGYYELYNPYSGLYLAPQIKDQQILSSDKIGINLPGRGNNGYYSDIQAWDKRYYSYAAVKADGTSAVVSAPKYQADTFYFAKISTSDDQLTPVETIDNTQYGITIKMQNYTNKAQQDAVLGDDGDYKPTVATTGILSTDLKDDGYPMTKDDQSLLELYNEANEVNHLFISNIYETSGYFEFDSCQNYATLYKDGLLQTDFTVYKELGSTDNATKPSLQHGQFFPYNAITAGNYTTKNGYNLYDALQNPLSDDDPRKYERLHLVSSPDYNLGMELDASFEQTPSGKDLWGHDMIFEFTGDDDFWLYVDGELVIDLGGVHSALAGKVNFATGDVEVNGKKTTLRQIFYENYIGRGHTEEEATEYVNGIFVKKTDDDGKDHYVFEDYSSHSMKIFYMERGLGASNLHMRFNLTYIQPGSVVLSKNVTGSDDLDFELVQYPYQIYYRTKDQASVDSKGTPVTVPDQYVSVNYQNSTKQVDFRSTYTPPGENVEYQNVFFLYPDENVIINFPEDTFEYRIVECAVNKDVYDETSVNNGTAMDGEQITSGSRRYNYNTGWKNVEDDSRIVFNNHVDPNGLRNLTIEKILKDENGQNLSVNDDSTTFQFRLSLSNGVEDSSLKLANMCKYYVTDANGNLCIWDTNSQRLMPTSKTDYSALSTEEKYSYTFESSMNGAISEIPAGYKVVVLNLPVGTKFMVEERSSEIPLGYKFVEYDGEEGTYISEDDKDNIGWIRANNSPKLEVVNRRGWGLSVQKNWSDDEYVSERAPIYVGVYVKNTLLDGSVRRIKYPDTSVEYYFDTLQVGASLEDYKVYEVGLENASYNETTGEVTYTGTPKHYNGGEIARIAVKGKNETVSAEKPYTVNYTEGAMSGANNNIRYDEINNDRGGGIVLDLFHWADYSKPLQNGIFELYDKDNNLVGEFTTNENGKITILYNFERGEENTYTLKEIKAPQGYIGLPNSATFYVDTNSIVHVSGNDYGWEEIRSISEATDGDFIAYVDIFNRPYKFEVVKIDRTEETPLKGVHFSLYKQVKTSSGTTRKDYLPVSGFEDFESDEDGILPGIDETLQPGTYYLVEEETLTGYTKLQEDIVFTIPDNGKPILVSCETDSAVMKNENGKYTLSVSNKKDSKGYTLTVEKTVTGSMGNKAKDFTFTFDVTALTGSTGITDDTEYAWTKNGETQESKLKTGDAFKLAHGDVVNIVLPDKADVTITEITEGYTSVFRLDGEQDGTEVSTRTITVDADKTLYVTNTLEGIIPTGVSIPIGMLVLAGLIAIGGIVGSVLRQRKMNEDC